MKKIACLLAALLLLVSSAVAETLTIDLAVATEEEVSAAMETLKARQIELITARLSAEIIAPDTDGITFRNIPWNTKKPQAEEIIGMTSKYYGTKIRHLEILEYPELNIAFVENGGCHCSYSSMNVAGYTPSGAYIDYIYPIVDGVIVRDDNLAQAYLGYYYFNSSDFKDIDAVYADFDRKLTSLYGKPTETKTKYHEMKTWHDENGNILQLVMNDGKSHVALGYMAADAETRLIAMEEAILQETLAAEEMERLQNTNNTDGL